MTNTFLISGASGRVGRHLVADLIASGHQVRALTRTPEKADLPAATEVVSGSFERRPDGIFDGVAAAFVFPADGAAAFAQAARRVRRWRDGGIVIPLSGVQTSKIAFIDAAPDASILTRRERPDAEPTRPAQSLCRRRRRCESHTGQ